MQVGLMAPQGWKGEYDGWRAADAWGRTVELARQADELGFESLWVFDHFTTVPVPRDELTFESFSTITALAMVTRRMRLGHMVVCGGFRNPALTAKMAGTVDVIAGGRFELGIGAGWKEDEWRSFGYGFPTLGERMDALADQLEIITRMLAPGRATYRGRFHGVSGAINEPKGLQSPRIPIVIGGNGREKTFRYAARFADELNLVYIRADEVPEAIAVLHERCAEVGRAPETLRVSLYCRDEEMRPVGQERIDTIAGYAEIGLDRLVAFPGRWAPDADGQARFAEDCVAAGIVLDPAPDADADSVAAPAPVTTA